MISYLRARGKKINQDACLSPYIIMDVRSKGTVRVCKGKVKDTLQRKSYGPSWDSIKYTAVCLSNYDQ